MNAKAKHICNTFIDRGCRTVCDLSEACVEQADDTLENGNFHIRMDKAAELIELKGWE